MIHSDYKGQTLNVFVVMTGAYKFASDLVKYIKLFNNEEQEDTNKVALRPYFFKIDKNNHPEIFENPIVNYLFNLY